jgi:hypothetical protein
VSDRRFSDDAPSPWELARERWLDYFEEEARLKAEIILARIENAGYPLALPAGEEEPCSSRSE